MRESLVIDGKEFDLSEPFGVTVQGINLSDYTMIREAFTTTIKGPPSQNNLSIFKHPNVIGIPNPEAYRSKRASVLSEGMPLIQDGSVQLASFGEQINLTVIGKGVEFFNDIETKSLKDITWGGSNNQTYGALTSVTIPQGIETWVDVDYTATTPIEGSYNVYGKVSRDTQVPPFIQKSLVLEKIVEQAGYQFNDELLADYGHYTRSFISLQVPIGKKSHDFDGNLYIQEWMHDVNQKEFFKWVMHQYGCMVTVIDDVVTLIPVKYIQNLKAKAPDWSDKIDLSTDPEIGYDTGYAKVNRWEYAQHDTTFRGMFYAYFSNNILNGVSCSFSDAQRFGQVAGANQNLTEKRVVSQSGFYVAQEITINNAEGNPRKVIYMPCFDGDTETFVNEYPMHDTIIPETSTTYKKNDTTNEAWDGVNLGNSGDYNGSYKVAWFTNQDSSTTVSNTLDYDYGLSHQDHLLDTFFPASAVQFISQPLTVTAKFNLSSSDVKFFADGNKTSGGFYFERYAAKVTPIYCSHLNGHYVVSRISNYVSGRPVQVILMRV